MHFLKRFTYATFVISAIFVISLLCRQVGAQIPQEINITSSPNPVGSGARAIGMGSAFIAVADDATAASWNPAGLTQLKKPEVSFAVSYFKRRDDFSVADHPETSGIQKTTITDLNFASVAYPFELFERNMIVSLNYQLLYEFDHDIKTNVLFKDPGIHYEQKVDFRQRGKLSALSPAYAIDITPTFSLGFTGNIWTDKLFWSNGWKSTMTSRGNTYQGGSLNSKGVLTSRFKSQDYDRYYGFSGFNMNIGFLWHINSVVTIGGVVKTPFTGDLEHERLITTTTKTPGGLPLRSKKRIDEDVDLDMPLSYGLGIALRFSDRFTLSCDVYRTEWDHFRLEDGDGNRLNPITGKPSYQSSSDETHQVRLGAEYLFILTKAVVPVRWGLFYDPEPSENNPDDYWGFSLGTGIAIGKIIFDCAYQFRYGNNMEGEVFNLPSANADVTQHLVLTSLIYHF